MRILRNIVLAIVVLVIVAVAIGYLLPQKVEVARSTDIAAPPSAVFPLVADLRQNGKWSPWLGIDPNIKVTFSGPEVGVDQKMSWESDHPNVGKGSQTIVAYEPDTKVVTALDFGAAGQAVATATVEPAGEGGARVTWAFETDLGMNLVARYFGLAMEGMVAPDFEKGLAKLKEVAEAEAAAKPAVPDAPSMSSEPAQAEPPASNP